MNICIEVMVIEKYIAWFSDLNKDSLPLAGGKGNNLGIMYNLGLPVPGGFVLTTYAFKHFIHVTGIDTKIFSLLHELDVEDNDKLQAAEKEIQGLILSTPMPLQIRQAILEAYEHMNVDPAIRGSGVEGLILPGRDAANVAVRSSATAEDLPSISEEEPVLVIHNEKPFFGKIKELYELYQDGDSILVPSLENNMVCWNKASGIYAHRSKEELLYKITTSTGKQITVSGNHSLLVLNEDTFQARISDAHEVHVGLRVPVVKKIPQLAIITELDLLDYLISSSLVEKSGKIYIKNNSSNWIIQYPFPRKIQLTSDFAYFLGLYCAEGSLYENNCVMLTNGQNETLERARRALTSLGLSISPHLNKSTMRIYCKTLSLFLASTCGKPLENVKGKGKGALTKKVPSFIFGSSEKVIGAFLQGYFDGDGTVNYSTISCTSASKELISGISTLLQLLGIEHHLGETISSHEKWSNAYRLAIASKDAFLFKDKVHFSISYKATLLERLVKKSSGLYYKNGITPSKELSKIIRKEIEQNLPQSIVQVPYCNCCQNKVKKDGIHKNTLRYYCANCKKMVYEDQIIFKTLEKYVNYSSQGRFQAGMVPWNKSINTGSSYSLSTFKEILSNRGVVQVTETISESVLWDEIVSVEKVVYSGLVYDFTVPHVETFSAGYGGIITHNTASFAGEMATYLNIKGPKNLLAAVLACWASLYTARAMYYRVKNHFPHDKVFIAVVIQKMVNSEVAGVMFSVNPVSQDPNEILIEASYGLGEAVVSGAITPDEYSVKKKGFTVEKKIIAKKTWMYVRDPQTLTTVKVDVPKERQEEDSLHVQEIKKLAEYAVKLEEHYKKAQDIEFAVEKGKVYITQTRAITTLKKKEVKTEEVIEKKKEERKDLPQELEIKDAVLLVSGIPASPGIGKGKVVIVHDVSDLKKVQKGDVLVARMTTPDHVVAMERAEAIITDAGGSTCFSGETILLTDKGFRTIKEVYDSEETFLVPSLNRDSLQVEWKPITAKMKREAETIVVSCSQSGKMKGSILTLTPDHKMLVFENRELVAKKISDILQEDKKVLALQRIPVLNSSNQQDNDKAYLLGALMSDGYMHLTRRRGTLVFAQKSIPEKEEFISTVVHHMYSLYNKTPGIYEKKSSGGFIRGRKINGSLENKNYTWGSKTATIELLESKSKLVETFLHCNKEMIYNFFAGVIDGDGSFNHSASRINIYAADKKKIREAIVVGCLRLGFIPQVTVNRNIYNIQIVEKVDEIISYTHRVHGNDNRVIQGTRFFSAKQLLSDIVDSVNYKGQIKPYVKSNLLLDAEKIQERVLPLCSSQIKNQLRKILDSDVRTLRVSFVSNGLKQDVYNITIEGNHNYSVFTKNLTPILVNNCHAAIVSREMGIPCIVGTDVATVKLKEGMFVTVDADKGKVYEGNVSIAEKEKEERLDIKTKIAVKVILDMPQLAERAVATGADGVGLLRSEFINMQNREHPVYMIHSGKTEEFVSHLTENLKIICKAFKGKPVWYRTLDARTDEFRNLPGGETEPEEDNPMMGWRSIRRSLDQPELLKAEFEAITRVHKAGYTNIGVMLPLVTDPGQVHQAKKIFKETTGLTPMKDIQFGIMVETPAAVQMIEELCQEGISFVSLGTNDLTQFTLACDRNSGRVAKLYDEMHPAVLRQIHKVVQTCKKYKVETSICGQAGSRIEMAQFLSQEGIDSISANMDAVTSIRRTVAKVEGLLQNGGGNNGKKERRKK